MTECYRGDEPNRVQTATNLGKGWKVRCNNEQNHMVSSGVGTI